MTKVVIFENLSSFIKFLFFLIAVIFPSYFGNLLLNYIGAWIFLFFPAYMVTTFFMHLSITRLIKKKRYKEDYDENFLLTRGDAGFAAIMFFIPTIVGLIYTAYKYFN